MLHCKEDKMASIKGISIKKRTKFKGHEGEPCTQGDLYIDGKPVGSYSDSSHMGPTDIDIKADFNELFNTRIKEYFTEHPDPEGLAYLEDADIFLEILNDLIDMEARFKRITKKGYSAIGIDGNKSWDIPEVCIEEFIKDQPNAKIYKSLAEFNI